MTDHSKIIAYVRKKAAEHRHYAEYDGARSKWQKAANHELMALVYDDMTADFESGDWEKALEKAN